MFLRNVAVPKPGDKAESNISSYSIGPFVKVLGIFLLSVPGLTYLELHQFTPIADLSACLFRDVKFKCCFQVHQVSI